LKKNFLKGAMQDAKIMLQKVKIAPYGTDDDSLYEVFFNYFLP